MTSSKSAERRSLEELLEYLGRSTVLAFEGSLDEEQYDRILDQTTEQARTLAAAVREREGQAGVDRTRQDVLARIATVIPAPHSDLRVSYHRLVTTVLDRREAA